MGYFMGYYTMWLVLVKRFFVPFWELAHYVVGRYDPDGPSGGRKPLSLNARQDQF